MMVQRTTDAGGRPRAAISVSLRLFPLVALNRPSLNLGFLLESATFGLLSYPKNCDMKARHGQDSNV